MGLPQKTQDAGISKQSAPSGSGRPALSENRNVSEDIVNAAIACLASKSPQQLTTKEIASLAGTRPAMIYYYFGSKDGLLEEVVRRGLHEILAGILAMREAILRNEVDNPTRSMIALFSASYNQRPALSRILISEMLREDSPIRSFFVRHWPAHGKVMMADSIAHLSAAGYYRKDINIEGICTMIRSVVFFPLITQPYMGMEGQPVEHYLDDQWIDFISTVFDCYLCPQK